MAEFFDREPASAPGLRASITNVDAAASGRGLSAGRPSAPVTPPLPRDIPALTSLRFFASLFVLLLHSRAVLPPAFHDYTSIVVRGGLSVDFFMILSGFILSHAYFGAIERGSFDNVQFFWKRLGRIYPLHLMTLAAYVVLICAFPALQAFAENGEVYALKYVPLHVILVHDWGGFVQLSLNYPTWSLSAEWFAYLLFPFAVLAVLRLRLDPSSMLTIVVAVIWGLWYVSPEVFGQPLNTLTWNNGLVSTFPEFVLGIAVYRIAATTELGRLGARVALWTSIVGIIVVGHFAFDRIFAVPGFAVLIYAVAALSRGTERGALEHPVLVYLGEISFSVFMIHAFCLTLSEIAATEILGPAVYAAWKLEIWFATIPAIYCLSALSYHFIEVPGRRFVAARDPRALLGALRRRNAPVLPDMVEDATKPHLAA
jgi:peptidoglycan/LPS O-acetylase OafA/YrhL